MNITPSYNAYSNSYNKRNQVAFGRFEKPTNELMGHFRDVLSGLNADGRKVFIEEMNSIVKGNEKCSVPITQGLTAGYSPCYCAIVNGKSFSAANSSCKRSDSILAVMTSAAKEALNVENLNANMQQIKKIFE